MSIFNFWLGKQNDDTSVVNYETYRFNQRKRLQEIFPIGMCFKHFGQDFCIVDYCIMPVGTEPAILVEAFINGSFVQKYYPELFVDNVIKSQLKSVGE